MGGIFSSPTPLKKIQSVLLAFGEVPKNLTNNNESTKLKVVRYVENCANLFYHNNDAAKNIQRYAKMEILFITFDKEYQTMLIKAVLSVDQQALRRDDKTDPQLTQEQYIEWISKHAFETAPDHNPIKNITLIRPNVYFK